MTKEDIEKLINAGVQKEVQKQLKESKRELAIMVRKKFDCTGEYAKAYRLMKVIEEWAET